MPEQTEHEVDVDGCTFEGPLGNVFTLKRTLVTPLSVLRVTPHINLDGTSHNPVVDIYWNQETKQLDAKYDGPVSGAVKTLMDQFAKSFTEYLIGMGIAIKPQE